MPEAPESIHVLGSRQFGGADQFCVRLVRALRDAGQAVTAVNRRGSPVAMALAGDGVEQIHLPLANSYDLWTVWRMRRLVASRAPCVVQTYMGRATRLTRLPDRSRAVHVARLGGQYKIDGYYRHAHAWIGNTKGLCDHLVKEGLPAARVFHIGNFVPDCIDSTPAEIEGLRRKWAIPADAWVLFTLGRLISLKGFGDLLEALARLPRAIGGRPVVLLLAGSGPLEAELKAHAMRLGLDDRVRWLGWQDPPDAYFNLADIFVCPSRRETLGNVILEAWNHKLPVVSTNTPGAVELIEDGRTGMLTPIREPQALADRLEEMLNATANQRVAMGAAGREFLNARFGKTAIVNAYLALYVQLLSGAAR